MISKEYLFKNKWNLKQKMSLYIDIYERENSFGFHFELHQDNESGEWWLQIDDNNRMSCGSIWVRDINMLKYIINNYK